MDKLPDFPFDKLSFWLGFLSGSIIWWLLSKIKLDYKSLFNKISIRKFFEKSSNLNTKKKYYRELLDHTQHLHLLSSMFSLDEILIPPLITSHPPRIEPGAAPVYEDIFIQTIPFLPDCTKLVSALQGNRIPVDLALAQGANLVIVGSHGSGKTTALADLTSKLIREQSSCNDINSLLPILIDASTCSQNNLPTNDIIATLSLLICNTLTSLNQKKIKNLISQHLHENSGMLIFDGMDELSYDDYCLWVQFIELIISQYPTIRILTTSSLEFYNDVTIKGFIPVAISEWNIHQKNEYLEKWNMMWGLFINSENQSKHDTNLIFYREIINNNKLPEIPIFFVLKVLNTYLGNPSTSNVNLDILSTHINRLISSNKEKLLALQKFAFQSFVEEIHLVQENDIDKWEPRWEKIFELNQVENIQLLQALKNDSTFLRAKVNRFLSEFIELGLAKRVKNGYIALSHPLFTAYLASEAIKSIFNILEVEILKVNEIRQPWETSTNTLNFLLPCFNSGSLPTKYFFEEKTPCRFNFFKYLRFSEINRLDNDLKIKIFRSLVSIIKNDTLTLHVRLNALCTFIRSGDNAIPFLLKELSNSNKPSFRLLSCYGFGLLQNPDFMTQIEILVNDEYPQIQRASILAIATNPNRHAFYLLTELLLNGNEFQQQGAAEVLAKNEQYGHQILKDNAAHKDLMVRRAVIYGLQQINQDWSINTLKNIQIEEAQWVIKDAATQALDYLNNYQNYIPSPYPEIYQIPWLIAFAGERGIGLSPGSHSEELLLAALAEGTDDQIIAALDYLKFRADKSMLPAILDVYENHQGEIQAYAYNAIWHLSMKHPNLFYPLM